eukprot:g33167.t1
MKQVINRRLDWRFLYLILTSRVASLARKMRQRSCEMERFSKAWTRNSGSLRHRSQFSSDWNFVTKAQAFSLEISKLDKLCKVFQVMCKRHFTVKAVEEMMSSFLVFFLGYKCCDAHSQRMRMQEGERGTVIFCLGHVSTADIVSVCTCVFPVFLLVRPHPLTVMQMRLCIACAYQYRRSNPGAAAGKAQRRRLLLRGRRRNSVQGHGTTSQAQRISSRKRLGGLYNNPPFAASVFHAAERAFEVGGGGGRRPQQEVTAPTRNGTLTPSQTTQHGSARMTVGRRIIHTESPNRIIRLRVGY